MTASAALVTGATGGIGLHNARQFADRGCTEAGGGRVRFVRVMVDQVEQERRLTDPSRREFHKLTDLATLRRSRAEPDVEQPPTDLGIDTTLSLPPQTAKRIAEYFGLPSRARTELYPSDEPP